MLQPTQEMSPTPHSFLTHRLSMHDWYLEPPAFSLHLKQVFHLRNQQYRQCFKGRVQLNGGLNVFFLFKLPRKWSAIHRPRVMDLQGGIFSFFDSLSTRSSLTWMKVSDSSSKQGLYSEKLHKCSFISIIQCHQKEPCFQQNTPSPVLQRKSSLWLKF